MRKSILQVASASFIEMVRQKDHVYSELVRERDIVKEKLAVLQVGQKIAKRRPNCCRVHISKSSIKHLILVAIRERAARQK